MKRGFTREGFAFSFLVFGILTSWSIAAAILLCPSIGEGKSLFPEIKGWKETAPVRSYSPNRLFDYIDGAADLYLTYDFQELLVQEYQNEEKATVVVEIYRHPNPLQAFGIYSQERRPGGNFVEVGVQGYTDAGVLNFLAANYYVKISSYEVGEKEKDILLTFARTVAANLGEKGEFPATLSAFPGDGKKNNSEKFIKRDFLGYSFLHSGFTADYETGGKKFQLFVIEGTDEKDRLHMLQAYMQKRGSSLENPAEGGAAISDPYHGIIELRWRGNYIWGILNLGDGNLRSKYLALLGDGLGKKGR